IEAPGAGIVVTGEYLAVDEPSHLSFSWRWADADGTSIDEACDVRIESAGSGTHLTVRHTGPWTDDTPAENYRQGWDFTLGQLRRALQA
ncbi:MAG: SRPBCC domain-containing protein, partial [Microbacterium sp.]